MGRLSCRCSLARESWERHSTGTFSSFAMIFIMREMSLTTCWRLSFAQLFLLPDPCMSWR